MTEIVTRDEWGALTPQIRAATGVRKFGVSRAALLTPKMAEAFGVEYRTDSYFWTLSGDKRDRYRDIIEVPGWTYKNYLAAGAPVLWDHNMDPNESHVPIGTMLALWTESGNDEGKNRFRGIRHLHRETRLSSEVARLIEIDVLRASSVGFLPTQVEDIREGDALTGFRFKRQDLLEDSVVPVPAYPEALVGHKGAFPSYLREVERCLDTNHYAKHRDAFELAFEALRSAETFVTEGLAEDVEDTSPDLFVDFTQEQPDPAEETKASLPAPVPAETSRDRVERAALESRVANLESQLADLTQSLRDKPAKEPETPNKGFDLESALAVLV